MSEEGTPPKKVARKRVVKKGVRGPRAPKNVAPEMSDDEDTFELAAPPAAEVAEAPEEKSKPAPAKKKAGSGNRAKKQQAEEPTIEVVEEGSAPVAPSSEEGETRESDSNGAGEEGEDRRENSRRRNRNRRGGGNREEGSAPKRPTIDLKEAAEKAWEIYQGELEEEGVSLVDPRRAREVARRCLELASVFCEERDRFLDR
jgi:hypothetical protein